MLNVVSDPTVRTGLLTSGQVDFVTVVNPDDIDLIKGNKDLNFAAHTGNVVPWVWYFNEKGFGTSDIRVRDAFREALDLDTLVPAIFKGTSDRTWSQLGRVSSITIPSSNAAMETMSPRPISFSTRQAGRRSVPMVCGSTKRANRWS